MADGQSYLCGVVRAFLSLLAQLALKRQKGRRLCDMHGLTDSFQQPGNRNAELGRRLQSVVTVASVLSQYVNQLSHEIS